MDENNDCYACAVAKPGRCPSHMPKRHSRGIEQLTLWPDEVFLKHVLQGDGPKHRGDCPACKAAFDKGASWTSLPWSETYWAS